MAFTSRPGMGFCTSLWEIFRVILLSLTAGPSPSAPKAFALLLGS